MIDPGEHRSQGSLRSTHGCVSDQSPQLAWADSVPLELGEKVEHVATQLGDRRAGPPLPPPLPAQGGRVVTGCW